MEGLCAGNWPRTRDGGGWIACGGLVVRGGLAAHPRRDFWLSSLHGVSPLRRLPFLLAQKKGSKNCALVRTRRKRTQEPVGGFRWPDRCLLRRRDPACASPPGTGSRVRFRLLPSVCWGWIAAKGWRKRRCAGRVGGVAQMEIEERGRLAAGEGTNILLAGTPPCPLGSKQRSNPMGTRENTCMYIQFFSPRIAVFGTRVPAVFRLHLSATQGSPGDKRRRFCPGTWVTRWAQPPSSPSHSPLPHGAIRTRASDSGSPPAPRRGTPHRAPPYLFRSPKRALDRRVGS
jgi:hypothetical protein